MKTDTKAIKRPCKDPIPQATLSQFTIDELEAEVFRRKQSNLNQRVSVHGPGGVMWGEDSDLTDQITIKLHQTFVGREQNAKVQGEWNLLEIVELLKSQFGIED